MKILSESRSPPLTNFVPHGSTPKVSRLRAILGCLLSSSVAFSCALASRQSRPAKPPVPKVPLTDAQCDTLELNSEVSIINWSASARQLVQKKSQKGALAVTVQRKGCQIKIIPQTLCDLGVSYEYRRSYQRNEDTVETPKELWNLIPLAVKKEQRLLSSDTSIKLIRERSALLKIRAEDGVLRRSIRNRKCRDVTHIVNTIELGRLVAVHGSTENLENYDGVAMPKLPLSTIDYHGDSASCQNLKLIQPPECRSPIRLHLTPLVPASPIEKPRMLKLGPGSFRVPDAKGTITLNEYKLDQREVTAAEYDRCVLSRRCTPAGKGPFCTSGVIGKENHPINCIDWRQAKAVCAHMKKQLPTESQWLFAAMGDESSAFPWGDRWPPRTKTANLADQSVTTERPFWRTIDSYRDGFVGTSPVGQFQASSSKDRFFDLAGNVSEWTHDWHSPRYGRTNSNNPKGPRRGKAKVVKGSSFGQYKKSDLATKNRLFYDSRVKSMHIGVRCAQ